MSQQVALGALAIGIGMLAGVVLFVPFVAISYRRRGRLSFGRMLLWIAALVYFWAIWTYTLLPLPDPATIRCVGVNLDVWKFVEDLQTAVHEPGTPLTHPAFLQLALNVLLFVPLGFFIRVLGGRGILTALFVGLGVSLFIETTQVTGVWGLYPCAYRVFDVDDLLTNTTGAVIGSLLALVVPRRLRGSAKLQDAELPRPVTRGRRAVAMLCDLLGAVIVQATVSIAVQTLLVVTGHRDLALDGTLASVSGVVVASATWLVVVLVGGRSVGDWAVELRYTGGPLPEPLARLLRWLGGVSGYLLLDLLAAPWSGLSALFAIVSVVLLFTTERGRGLPGVLSVRRLDDARALEDAPH
jgi:glycopeptide antibiotics resistance protein